jgi:hypothetical protein
MQLVLHRDQRTGMMGMGSQIFQLSVRAEISLEEKEAIRKYKLGKTLLYQKIKGRVDDITGSLVGTLGALAANIALNLKDLTISVDDLTNGKMIECKDILEMLAVENQVRQAGEMFGTVLRAAVNFGGDEIIEI